MGFFSALFGKSDNMELKEAINNGAFLVDVRTPSEVSEESVNGAVNIPLDKILDQLTKFKNKKSIVVFCRSGNRSNQAKYILEQNGFQNVINGGSLNNIQNILTKN